MRYSSVIFVLLLFTIIIAGCSQPKLVVPLPEPTPVPAPEVPVQQEPPKPEIPTDIQALIVKSQDKLTNYYYTYNGPETGNMDYQIYIKGNKRKIIMPKETTVENDRKYNTIYLDADAKTAEAYCSNCLKSYNIEAKDKIMDVDYQKVYLPTSTELLALIKQAEKLEELTIEAKEAAMYSTNIGNVTIATYSGFIYEINKADNKWRFGNLKINFVKDEDITPP